MSYEGYFLSGESTINWAGEVHFNANKMAFY